MNNLNEQFIGEEIDCEALGVGTIVEFTESTVKIATEFGVIELDADDIELDEEAEELEELSKKTVTSYVTKSLDSGVKAMRARDNLKADTAHNYRKKYDDIIKKRSAGLSSAKSRLGIAKEEVELEEGQNKPYVKPHYDAKENQSGWKASNKHGNVKFFGKDFKASAMKHAGINEEVELEEGRGRKPKQPKEGEKPTAAWLRHLERQKGGGEKEEVEALGAQLRKAVSINKPVTFMNGDKKEITAGHANLFHDHMDARKMTTDKQKFQNDAHASHDAFMKAIKSPIPGR